MPSTSSPPLISVIIPTYNRAHLLPDVLASVFAQTDCPPFEVVVVDDASTDDTATIVRATPHPVVLVSPPRNGGVATARQAGVDRSRGRLLAFHDSDDLMLPGRIGRLAAYLAAHPDVGAVFANGVVERDEAETRDPVIPAGLAARLDGQRFGVRDILRDGLPVYLQSALIRRSVFDAAGGIDTTLDRHADLELVCRLVLTAPAAFVDEAVFRYCLHSHNQTRDRLRLREGLVVVMRRLRERRPGVIAQVGETWFRRREARHLYRIARARRRSGERARASAAIREALALEPGSLRYRWLSWRI